MSKIKFKNSHLSSKILSILLCFCISLFIIDTPASAATTITYNNETFILIGTATKSGLTATLSTTVKASDGYTLKIYCPNNNKADLVQGTITLTPVSSGTTVTYSFLNYSNVLWAYDLSSLSGNGRYKIKITASAIGSSGQGKIYYRLA